MTMKHLKHTYIGEPSGWSGWSTDHPVAHPSTIHNTNKKLKKKPSGVRCPSYSQLTRSRGANSLLCACSWVGPAPNQSKTGWIVRRLDCRRSRRPIESGLPPSAHRHRPSLRLALSPGLPPSPTGLIASPSSVPQVILPVHPRPSSVPGFFRSLVLLIGECFF